ncbi:MAG: hypothetical protein NTW62_00620 [Candidatus Nomurabacteria bacterium]|nr:hypothetical protein [Candidatus Nomurabacteria bacterium]
MLPENKNLKDSQKDIDNGHINMVGTEIDLKDISIPYPKTNKLIMALYIVTDVMDKEEPIRNKLRTLGANIISDINILALKNPMEGHQLVSVMKGRISEIMNFLDIASTVSMISEMNKNILKKEFTQLYNSVTESSYSNELSLSEFFTGLGQNENIESNDFSEIKDNTESNVNNSKGQLFKRHGALIPTKRQIQTTRLGLQNGHSLMKALSDMKSKHPHQTSPLAKGEEKSSFDLLKKNRREDIVKAIKENKKVFPNGLTIKDIKDTKIGTIVSCGEKTLQRELVSMVKDSVLKKTGEKRWSRYFLSM